LRPVTCLTHDWFLVLRGAIAAKNAKELLKNVNAYPPPNLKTKALIQPLKSSTKEKGEKGMECPL
jgi:hypothetical protein